MSESPEKVSTTLRIGPPKYRATLPANVRDALGTEGKEAIYQIDVTVKKVVDNKDDN